MRPSFQKFLGNIKCAEVGVNLGANAMEMLATIPCAEFYLIDSYDVNNPTFQQDGRVLTLQQRSEVIDRVKDRLRPYNDRIQLIVKDSVSASAQFPAEYFDYVYIDAEHDYESVMRDLRAWYGKVKSGGTIAGHDYGVEGVKQAVHEFFDKVFGEDVIVEGTDWRVIKSC